MAIPTAALGRDRGVSPPIAPPTTRGEGGAFLGSNATLCSFCGKSAREVGPMVEGPNEVYICRDCTGVCQTIFGQQNGGSNPGR
jgi:ATP-dependent Clp protease ATP-binding subunit ClpX